MPETAHPSSRLYYLDWLRVGAMVIVFAVHVTMPFQAIEGVWMIQFEQTSILFSLSAAFFFQWVMHLFFFMAGASTFFALGTRGNRQYLSERFVRLAVPFLFGLLVLSPLQVFFSLKGMRLYEGNFRQFYAGFYQYCAQGSSQILIIYGCLVRHLWFLGFLLVYSAACLPLMVWFRKPVCQPVIQSLARVAQKPSGMLLFIIPVALIQIALKAQYPDHQNWSDFFVWMAYFLFGFIFMMDTRFIKAAIQQRWIALGVGLIGFITIIILLMTGNRSTTWELSPIFTWDYALYQILRSLNSWAWVVFVLGTGAAYFVRNTPALKYSSEAVLPVYILHHVVVVWIAYLLIDWQEPLWVKFPTFSCMVFLITMGIYVIVIRRFKAFRFLLGMRN